MNSCSYSGNMGNDPELRYGKNSGKAVCNFSVAVQRRFDREKVDFVNCVAFGPSAEYVAKYGKKGAFVVVHGEMQNDPYTDKNGNRRDGWKCVCDQIEVRSKIGDSSSSNNSGNNNKPSAATKKDDSFMDVPSNLSEEELPFN